MFVEERKETVLHDNWVIVFDCFSFSPFLRNSCLLADPSMFEMLEAGLSHDLSLGVSAGLSFLPVTVGVRGSSSSVLPMSALGRK